VFWIDASNEENAESGFADLGQQAGKGATFAAGIHWLSTCTKSWLLIIDNADDPDMDVSNYFPSGGRGHILITTRNPEVIEYATIGSFQFRGMDPEEAITLLLKSAHTNDSEGPNTQHRKLAQGIASELGYLALALTLAGATIRRKIYTLERYLNYYLDQRKKMISYPQVSTADDANIITTWEIPFQRIANRKTVEYKDAVDIMHIFAFMHFESIPDIIFRKYSRTVSGRVATLVDPPDILQNKTVWDEEADARVRRALRILCDYSIVDYEPRSDDKGFCILHPVVHAWARGRLTPTDQIRWVGITASVLSDCISPNLEASGRQFRRLLLPHIDSCLHAMDTLFLSLPANIEQAVQVSRFALVYAENGLWTKALDLQLQVVKLRKKKLGKRHEDTMAAQSSLGYIYWNMFAIRRAIEVQYDVVQSRWLCRPSLRYWMTWPPWRPIHLSYCMALNEITQTLWLAGVTERSKQAGEKAMMGLMLHYGPDDPKTLDAMFNLARTYLHLAEYDKCHNLLVQVVKKRKGYFGPDHPDTLMARNELGMYYRAVGRLGVAERLVTNVYESRRKIMGEEHAYTLWSLNDLSKIVCDRGLLQKAASMLEEIIPIVTRTLGDDHVGMFMTKSNLARAYSLMKKWNEAEVILRELLAVVKPDHPDYIHVMHGYVHVLAKMGNQQDAEKGCNELLEVIMKTGVMNMDNPRSIAIAELLAMIYRAQERLDEIAALKIKVPMMTGDKYTEDSPFAMQ
jgi:tetratricopeptide (TPR) repeat protein